MRMNLNSGNEKRLSFRYFLGTHPKKRDSFRSFLICASRTSIFTLLAGVSLETLFRLHSSIKTPPPAQNEFLKRVNYCNFIILSVSPWAITSINASRRVEFEVMAPRWPQVNNGPEHINEHATYLREACNQLQAVDRGRHNQVPWNTVQTYLESTITLIGKVLKQPALREVLQQVQDAARCTQNLQKDITIIKNSVGLSTAPPNAGNFSGRRTAASSWAQVAAQAKGSPPLPPPVAPAGSATKAHPTVTAYKDRVVTVKLKDSGIIQRYRTHSAVWAKQQIEASIQNNAETKLVKVVAAHQLKSGDIQIFTSTTAEAAQLKEDNGWLGGLGAQAELIVPTYGVIVHGISTNSINVRDQKATIDQMLADNHTVISNAKISYVGWLTKEGNLKRASSIVVEFTDPVMANAVIYAGMAWDGQIHQCQLYDRACRIKQCFRCYQYGHITTQCNASQVCGYCAELHETKHCRRKEVEGFTPRCAVCKADHTAWSNACPARRKEMRRVEQAKEVRSIYWHVPPKNSPAPLGTHSTGSVDAHRDDTRARPPLFIQTSEDTTTNSESGPNFHGVQPSQYIQLPAGTPGAVEATTVQILVTPPAREGHGPQVLPPELSQGYVGITENPFHHMEEANERPSTYPDLGLEGVLAQEADEWLANLADDHDNHWLNTNPENPEEEPSPLTSTGTDPRTAQGGIYKGCKCPEHQDIYRDWPAQDAELTIAKCMRTCPYCGNDFPIAAELRKHMRKKYSGRNVTVVFETGGKYSSTTPSWTQRHQTESIPRQPAPRTTRSQSTTNSTNARQHS